MGIKKGVFDIDKECMAVMEYMGRDVNDGVVRGNNMKKTLYFIINNPEGSYNDLKAKLTGILGMGLRNVQENYLYCLEAFGFMQTFYNDNIKHYSWLGVNGADKSVNIKEFMPQFDNDLKEGYTIYCKQKEALKEAPIRFDIWKKHLEQDLKEKEERDIKKNPIMILDDIEGEI